MGTHIRAFLGVGAATIALTLSGCIGFAPAPAPVGGELGVTVDEEGRPVLVVQTCDAAPQEIHLAWGREGLDPTQENQPIGVFTARGLAAGTHELVLSNPGPGWTGEPFVLEPGSLGVIADGQTVQGETVAMVAFSHDDLIGLVPGQVLRVAGFDEDGETQLDTLETAAFAESACGSDR